MGSEILAPCLLMMAAFVGLILFSMLAKARQVQRARQWVATTATVTKSTVRSHRDPSKDSEGFDAEPLVTYEFQVAGHAYRGNRISFAGKTKGEDVEPTLDRYPVGKSVPVYYDPANPGQAVLERDLPQYEGRHLVFNVAGWLGTAVALPFGLAWVSDRVGSFLPDPTRGVPTTILLMMGGVVALITADNQRQVWATYGWSAAAGRILDTRAEARQQWDGDRRYTTFYHSEVVYAFEADGHQYISDRVKIGARFSGRVMGGAPGFVKRGLAKYPVGASVQVYYNPRNPSDCVLERHVAGGWLSYLIALALFAAALVISGLIG